MCELLCLTGKFTATSVCNKGPNAPCVPDSDNSSHKLSPVTCSVLSYLFLLSIFLSVTVLLIIKRGDCFLSFLFFPSRIYIYVGTQLLLNEIHSVADPFHAFPTTVEKEKVEILESLANKERLINK